MAKNTKQKGLGRGLGALFGGDIPVDVISPDVEILTSEELESLTKGSKPTKATPSKSGKSKAQTASGATKSSKSIDADASQDLSNRVVYIGVDDIKPNTNQPRKYFDETKIDELASSILEHGIIEHLIVRPKGSGFEIVAGERRYRAARKAGLKAVPCIIREFSDEETMLIAIVENMQREDLNPIEEAEGLNSMIKTYGLTQEQVSKSVGKSRPYISNSLRLLNLSSDIQDLIIDGKISAGHARALLSVKDEKKRRRLAERIATNGLSVRQAEAMASGGQTGKAKTRKVNKSDDIRSVEDELKSVLGTKVNIKGTGKRGAIEIEYYSMDELNRLIDMLRACK